MVQVWVPYPEMVADLGRLGGDVRADLFTGNDTGNDDVPGSAKDVEFYVVPYSFGLARLELAAQMPSLRVMQTLTAGYDHAVPYVPLGVTLCSARGVHDASTAELAVALTVASLRRIPEFVRAQEGGEWRHAAAPSLADRHVLIVGYGSIGAAVERRLLPFETTVTRVARRPRPDQDVHGTDELPNLLPLADVVIIVTPLTAETRHMVDVEFLARMKERALLVNVARGAVVDTTALLDALNAGHVRAALDVTDPEPLPADHPLWHAPGVLISPHVGGNSTAFLPRARAMVREQVTRYLQNDPLANVIVAGGAANPRGPAKE